MITLVLIIILLWLYLQWKWRKFVKLSKILKNNLVSIPFVGLGYMFMGDGKVVLQAIDKIGEETYKHGGITSAWLGPYYFVAISDPAIASLLSKECLEKHEIMVNCTKPLFRNSHVIAPEISLDRKIDFQDIKYRAFITGIEELSESVGSRFFRPWLHNNFIYKLLPEYKVITNLVNDVHGIINESIHLKRDSYDKISNDSARSPTMFKSFVDHYLTTSKSKKMNDTQIGEELLTLIIASADTTATSASFCIGLLAQYPEIQNRLYQEIKDQLPPGYTFDDILNLKYLDAFIKESLRLYTPVPVLVRTIDKDVTLPSGLVLPEGCGIFLHLRAINKNPDYWGPDAEEFRPERFLEAKLKHPAQFMSFSFGPRNCMGYRLAIMALKVTIATLVRHLRVCPVTDGKGKRTDFKLSYKVCLEDDNNFPVIFQLRD